MMTSGSCGSKPVTAMCTQSVGVPLTKKKPFCALRTLSGRSRVSEFDEPLRSRSGATTVTSARGASTSASSIRPGAKYPSSLLSRMRTRPVRRSAHRDGGAGLASVDALDLPGRGVDPQPLDVLEVGAGDAQVAGADGRLGGVELPPVIDPGLARRQAVAGIGLQLRMVGIGAVVEAVPLDHLGVFRDLAVDRPRISVVVRVGLARFLVAIRHDFESELGIDMDALESDLLLGVEVFLHEPWIDEQLLHLRLHPVDVLAGRAGLQYFARVAAKIL